MRAHFTAESLRQTLDFDSGGKYVRVNVRRRGSKNQSCLRHLEGFKVSVQVARIADQVFVRPELLRVYENADDSSVGGACCDFNQRCVSAVKCAHSGHERDRQSLALPLADQPAKLSDPRYDGKIRFSRCCADFRGHWSEVVAFPVTAVRTYPVALTPASPLRGRRLQNSVARIAWISGIFAPLAFLWHAFRLGFVWSER